MAAELQAVAQALFGVQKQGFARQGRLPQPRGLGNAGLTGVLALVAGVPAPFVQRQALFEVAAQQQGERLVPLRLRVVRLGAKRLVVAGHGGVQRLLLVQGVAPVVVRVGGVGVQGDGAVVAGNGCWHVAPLLQRHPPVGMRLHISRLQGNGPVIGGDCRAKLP